MALKTKEELKKLFETGDYPSGSDFSDLIDSCYNNSVSGNVIFNDSVEFKSDLKCKNLILSNQIGENFDVSVDENGNLIITQVS